MLIWRTRLPMIGESLAKKIEEIVETDRLRKLEYAQLEPGDVALKLFLRVYGVGYVNLLAPDYGLISLSVLCY